MTSNQVAYAGVLVEQDKLKETERHNQATEELTRQANNVAEMQANTDKWYKEKTADLKDRELTLENEWNSGKIQTQKEYNEAWASIERDRLNIDAAYKAESINIAQQEANTRSQAQAEVERHNKQMEFFSTWSNVLTDKSLSIQRQSVENENTYRLGMLGVEKENVRIKLMSTLNSYNLGLMNVAVQNRRNNIDQFNADTMRTRSEWEQRTAKENSGSSWFRAVMPFLLPTVDQGLRTAQEVLF